MEKRELDIWWSSLPIGENERLARKGLAKSGGDESQAVYPGCSVWWNSLEQKRKERIYHHCVASHGDELKEWKEGNPYGD